MPDNNISAKISDDASVKTPDSLPDNLPDNVLDGTPDNVPGKISNTTPDGISNHMPVQKPDGKTPVHVNVLRTGRPDEAQRTGLARLAGACRASDRSRLTMPEDADLYYMAYSADGLLASAAALTFYPESPGKGSDVLYAECSAFTCPELRRMGYFSAVFDVLSQDIENTDLYFLTDGKERGAMAALRSLGAVHDRDEYMMERTLDCAREKSETAAVSCSCEKSGKPAAALSCQKSAEPAPALSPKKPAKPVPDFSCEEPDGAFASPVPGLTARAELLPEGADEEGVRNVLLSFYSEDGTAQAAGPAGSCRLIFFGDSVCLCDFEIERPLRGRGLGKAALLLTLSLLEGPRGADGAQKSGTSGRDVHLGGLRLSCLPQAGRMFLHVSGNNRAAVSLYQKTGFRISETLSFYLY